MATKLKGVLPEHINLNSLTRAVTEMREMMSKFVISDPDKLLVFINK